MLHRSREKIYYLLMQATPVCGEPAYPVKHLQSKILELPVFPWPELAGQAVQSAA